MSQFDEKQAPSELMKENSQLMKSNEELMKCNEELMKSNKMLSSKNEQWAKLIVEYHVALTMLKNGCLEQVLKLQEVFDDEAIDELLRLLQREYFHQ